MKLNKIFQKLQNTINITKYERNEKELNKYIKIHNNTTYGTSFETLNEAKETIANFAKKNNVSIDIFDGRKIINYEEMLPSSLKNNLSDKMFLKVTNLLNGKSKEQIISARTDKVYPVRKENYRLLQDKDKNKEYLSTESFSGEDTFLRYVYRNIENFTKEVTGKKY